MASISATSIKHELFWDQTDLKQSICLMSKIIPHCFKHAIWLILFVLVTGCAPDENRVEEIKEKVLAGDHDEAVRLAHEYLGDDKRDLLVMLEYIAHEKSKAVEENYKRNVVIEDVKWSTDSSGTTTLVGRLLNRGDNTLTGIGARIDCIREGKTMGEQRFMYPVQILPGGSGAFQHELNGFTDCHDFSIKIINLGVKNR